MAGEIFRLPRIDEKITNHYSKVTGIGGGISLRDLRILSNAQTSSLQDGSTDLMVDERDE